ncbi:metal ABC transporter permease [Rugosimonospora africana]|uniref:ABC transporter permease n=1 Tax=Rugosimonospora africana TaxID=556532 RepID=A0A8J3VVR8_9ACTN|nr:iron chelate uptake ABC transporter family permease subunit [Rugosimonospora africana]GIH20199.1 ABC transporter permease [Rugosimonospora africana]
MTGGFSPNLLADIQDMWSYLGILNAFRAGTVVAVLAAAVGWFMVLRRQSFAGHTLAVAGFPGAAGAVLLGLGVTLGYFTFCVLAALIIAALPQRDGRRGYTEEPAIIGTVQAFALAAGMLFIALYQGFLNGTNALLFGSFLGITTDQVVTLALVALVALIALAVIGRPLLFASIDADVARAHGVPGRPLGAVFLALLGATAAEVSQITGALLIFALLVLPPATAQLLTPRPARSLALSIGLALITVWVGLFIAYYSPYPIGFWLTTVAFGLYALTYIGTTVRARTGTRATVHTPAGA